MHEELRLAAGLGPDELIGGVAKGRGGDPDVKAPEVAFAGDNVGTEGLNEF